MSLTAVPPSTQTTSHTLQFGLFITPRADNIADLNTIAALADRADTGTPIDFIGLQDHPYQSRFLDTFTLAQHMLSCTEHVRIITDVANLPLRPPAMMGKAAASMDLLSGGRFELGLGAGAFWDAIHKFGGPTLPPKQAADALVEAVTVLRAMWTGGRNVHVDGTTYQLRGAHTGPQPAHDIGIWLGVQGPRMLRLLGEQCDGWLPSNSYIDVDMLDRGNALIDAAASSVGRTPREIRRGYNVFINPNDDGSAGAFVAPWAERIAQYALQHRMDTFIIGVPDDDIAVLRRVVDDLIPAVRERFARG